MRENSSPTAVQADDEDGPTGPHVTRLVEVKPLTYMQLRLLAECTAGLQEKVNFVFRPDGVLEVTRVGDEHGLPDTAHDVLIPAQDSGKYPPNELRLRVGPGDEELVGSHDGDLVLPPGVADAVFWSDSSVHKFVVPYVASCGGDEAPWMVSMLQSAWNDYPAKEVTVYALVHLVRHLPGTVLSLENRLQVVFAETLGEGEVGPLKMKSLAEFLKEYPPVPPSRDILTVPSVAYHRGKGKNRQYPGYPTLRALAEHAASVSAAPGYFVFKSGGHGFQRHISDELPSVEPGDVVIPAYTPSVPPNRPQLHGVWCHTGGATAPNLAQKGDAVFWSNGTIEQFLYPYYASKGGLQDGLRQLLGISEVWLGDQSATGEEARALEHARTVAAEGEGHAFVTGLVHMPTSEWIPEEEKPEPEPEPGQTLDIHGEQRDEEISSLSPRREVGVLYHFNGQTHVTTADRFMARQWSRRG